MLTLKPNSYLYYFWQIITCSCFVLVVCVGVFFFQDENYILVFLCLLTLLVFVKQEIYYLSIKIVLNDNELYIPATKENKLWRVQFETNIRYTDIRDVEIIGSKNNSKNTTINSPTAYGYVVKKYLQITLQNGKIERIWLDLYTKKQTRKLLNKINIDNKLDVDGIMKKWFSTYSQYKKIYLNKK